MGVVSAGEKAQNPDWSGFKPREKVGKKREKIGALSIGKSFKQHFCKGGCKEMRS